jgi:hypothetical protein
MLPGVAVAAAAKAPVSKPTTVAPSSGASSTWNLDWTLPTAGKSGCLVCHGDPNLVRIIDGKTVSLWVSTEVLQGSAHKNVPCTECHVDFAYKTPHDTIIQNGPEWRAVAKLACKNCHRDAFSQYANGAHSPAGRPGDTSTVGAPTSSAPGKPRPLCGDCHGGHAIPSKTDTAAMEAVHASGLDMCGKCHEKAAYTYSDYYHGAAYKRGAADAPACWQCHNTHQILASKDRRSWTNAINLVDTCGQCHKGVNEEYTTYAALVHRKEATLQQNPVYAIANSAKQAIGNAFYQVFQVFQRNGS